MNYKRLYYYLIGIVIAVVSPWLLGLAGGFWLHVLVSIGIFGSLAVSLHLMLGYTGIANLAHGVLFGMGAYTSALLVMRLGVNFWLSIPIAGIAAVAVGFIVGYSSLRLRGRYFILVTIAFMRLMIAAYTALRGLTGGFAGLYPIPQASIFGLTLGTEQKFIWVYICFAFLLFTVFSVDRLINSRIGRALIAIREDEDLAKSSGINTFWYKMLSFCIATFFAGMAGALYATYMGVMTPAEGGIIPVVLAIAACVIGGRGTLLGPVIGTVIMEILPEILRVAERYYYMIFAVMLVVIIFFAPKGIMGVITSLRARRKTREALL